MVLTGNRIYRGEEVRVSIQNCRVRNLVFAASILLVLPSAQSKEPRPMSEMHGDCSNYNTDLKQELKAWGENAKTLTSGTSTVNASRIGFSELVDVKLSVEKQVTLAIEPEKPTKAPGEKFAGLFMFEAPKSGLYKISAGSKVWLEATDANSKRVVSDFFEMQSKCSKIFKTVQFRFQSGQKYFVQITGSENSAAKLLITSL